MKKYKKIALMTAAMLALGATCLYGILYWIVSKEIGGMQFGILDSGPYEGKKYSRTETVENG